MSSQLPWVEKYRPKTLSEIVGQNDLIERLKHFINDPTMPHLMFSGAAGTGKTTTALALVRDIQKDKMQKRLTWLELNASDSRGIDVIRTDVKDFARTATQNGLPFKILILDEADDMTEPAMQALRRIMEKYTKNCRFILICNLSNKIIAPIQSRCGLYRFQPLTIDQIRDRLGFIIINEMINIEDDAISTIAYLSNGDCRSAINCLQACSTYGELITKEIVYQITGKIDPKLVRDMIKKAVNGDFDGAYTLLDSFFNNYGMSAKNIIDQIYRELENIELDEEKKLRCYMILGMYSQRITLGSTDDVQLTAMLEEMTKLNK